jgi:hypothetical protein
MQWFGDNIARASTPGDFAVCAVKGQEKLSLPVHMFRPVFWLLMVAEDAKPVPPA